MNIIRLFLLINVKIRLLVQFVLYDLIFVFGGVYCFNWQKTCIEKKIQYSHVPELRQDDCPWYKVLPGMRRKNLIQQRSIKNIDYFRSINKAGAFLKLENLHQP